MPERWQQWMPFHIDKFRGSPEVQAMHPAARIGYIYLLASAWQSEDCTVSAEPMDLATESGLGDELWAVHGPRILRKFIAIANGRLSNEVLRSEWKRAKEQFERTRSVRSEAGKIGNAKRWSRNCDTEPSQTDRKGIASSSQNIATLTGTVTETKNLKTLAESAVAPPATRGKIIGNMPLPGQQGEFAVYEEDARGWQEAFPGVDVRQELKKCKQWLVDNPKLRKTASGMRRFINSWMARQQNQAQRTQKPAGTTLSNMKFMNEAQ